MTGLDTGLHVHLSLVYYSFIIQDARWKARREMFPRCFLPAMTR
jgi:hypothetical protein